MEKISRNVIQIGTIGDSKVGKTNMSTVYTEEKFNTEYITTLGFSCLLKEEKIKIGSEEKKIKIKIWDTAGQERFKSISIQYVKNCLGILLVYSITDKESFQNLDNWIKDVNDKKIYDNVPFVLIGNKCDLEKDRKVSKEEGEKFALKYNMKFFETSAKDNININEAFNALINEIVDVYKDEFFEGEEKVDDKNKDKKNNKEGGCCKKKNKKNDNEQRLNIKK